MGRLEFEKYLKVQVYAVSCAGFRHSAAYGPVGEDSQVSLAPRTGDQARHESSTKPMKSLRFYCVVGSASLI